MGYLRRGKWIRDEKFVCMCLWSCMNTVDVCVMDFIMTW
jgi:hypothetical protein